ncbi:hypothetical protein KB13_304 [beta proteobacterium KB13]|uniref:Uncharacterized protein n=1 Tax=beta proteobacterium KB13 TaxID=314607 RepID=B6BUB1_9PROT|nr:hypothetical protein KB13_304 [beta proteobacterium KB13]
MSVIDNPIKKRIIINAINRFNLTLKPIEIKFGKSKKHLYYSS